MGRGRDERAKRQTECSVLPALTTFRAAAEPGVGYTTAELLDFLRLVARKLQNGQPREFYSIRSIRQHARCPLSAVRRALDQLKREGSLTACWGSQTTLQPRRLEHDVHFNGSITELVPMHEFKSDPVCQSLAKTIQDELWQRRYACRMWFYDQEDANKSSYCDRILAEHPDSIIWVTPTPRVTMLGQRLLNCGIHVIRAMAIADVIRELWS